MATSIKNWGTNQNNTKNVHTENGTKGPYKILIRRMVLLEIKPTKLTAKENLSKRLHQKWYLSAILMCFKYLARVSNIVVSKEFIA
jgi:hypothetical protein